jgi:dTDP-4-amino-4,6-dideoxygalactose transaminase
VSEPIPLVDLAAQHAEIADELRAGFDRVMGTTGFVQGPEVAAFEAAYAAFCEVRHCVGVANGTDALELAFRAIGVGPGDEVIVPVNSFVASASSVARAGARPVFVDVDPECLLVDPDQVGLRIGARTRAILPVHLFGQVAPMERLKVFAADVALVEDAAQSQGARRHGCAAGAFGEVTATSFYPGKNLGAYGDAGAVLTDSDDIAARLAALRNHGSTSRYDHATLGFNSRMDTLQAVVLAAKLRRLDGWNAARRRAAARYDELLDGVDGVSRPATLPGNEHVWHLYVVRVAQRDRVLERLRAAGIGAGIHYPVPLHLQGAFAELGHRPGDFPVAERAAGEILSLPLFPHIHEEQQVRVVDELVRAVRDN